MQTSIIQFLADATNGSGKSVSPAQTVAGESFSALFFNLESEQSVLSPDQQPDPSDPEDPAAESPDDPLQTQTESETPPGSKPKPLAAEIVETMPPLPVQQAAAKIETPTKIVPVLSNLAPPQATDTQYWVANASEMTPGLEKSNPIPRLQTHLPQMPMVSVSADLPRSVPQEPLGLRPPSPPSHQRPTEQLSRTMTSTKSLAPNVPAATTPADLLQPMPGSPKAAIVIPENGPAQQRPISPSSAAELPRQSPAVSKGISHGVRDTNAPETQSRPTNETAPKVAVKPPNMTLQPATPVFQRPMPSEMRNTPELALGDAKTASAQQGRPQPPVPEHAPSHSTQRLGLSQTTLPAKGEPIQTAPIVVPARAPEFDHKLAPRVSIPVNPAQVVETAPFTADRPNTRAGQPVPDSLAKPPPFSGTAEQILPTPAPRAASIAAPRTPMSGKAILMDRGAAPIAIPHTQIPSHLNGHIEIPRDIVHSAATAPKQEMATHSMLPAKRHDIAVQPSPNTAASPPMTPVDRGAVIPQPPQLEPLKPLQDTGEQRERPSLALQPSLKTQIRTPTFATARQIERPETINLNRPTNLPRETTYAARQIEPNFGSVELSAGATHTAAPRDPLAANPVVPAPDHKANPAVDSKPRTENAAPVYFQTRRAVPGSVPIDTSNAQGPEKANLPFDFQKPTALDKSIDLIEPLRSDTTSLTSTSNPSATANAAVARSIAVQMAEAFIRQPDRPVEIALNPEELGRVRIALNSSDSSLLVTITADRPETLDLMRRHIEHLAAEFKRIGYTDVGFEFSGGDTNSSDQSGHSGNAAADTIPDDTNPELNAPSPAGSSGIDLRM